MDFGGVKGKGGWKNPLLFELTPGVANDIFHFIFNWKDEILHWKPSLTGDPGKHEIKRKKEDR